MNKAWQCTECNLAVTTTYCSKCNKNSRGGKKFVSKFSAEKPERCERKEPVARSNIPNWTCQKCNILIHSGREFCVRCKNDINGKPQMHKCPCGRNINIKFKTCRDCNGRIVIPVSAPKPFKPSAGDFDYDLMGRKLHRPILQPEQEKQHDIVETIPVKSTWGSNFCSGEGCNQPCGINLMCFSCIAKNSKEPVPQPKQVKNTCDIKDIPSGTLDFSAEDDGVECRDIPENDNIIITSSWDEL